MMKFKFIFSTLALLAYVVAGAQYKPGYYDAMDGKSKESLKAAVKTCVSAHTKLNYTNLPKNWYYTDVYPELYDGCKRWWDMYSNEIYLILSSQTPNSSFSANKMQREHSVPKSWWKYNNDVEYTPAYTDLWNLYPSDGNCNQKKSNYPFGEVDRASFDNGSAKVGSPVSGTGGGSATVFEPADEYKGDFARGIFYMACVYDDIYWTSSVKYNMFQQETWPTLKPWAYAMLLEWHHNDPVDQKEIDRNQAVEGQQGNRNPFIDFPNLADYIWGNLTSQVFYISEQGGGQIEIPSDTEITEPVNGEYLDFGQCAVDGTTSAYLRISGKINSELSLRVSNGDRNLFTLGKKTVSPVELNAAGSVLIPITFSPDSEGEKNAVMILYDGGLEGSIAVNLKGEALARPQLSTLTAYAPTEVSDESYVANWSLAPEVVDYYVVTRTIYGSDGTETEMLESGVNSLKIYREENVAESYSVQSSRLGVLSASSNTVTVGPGAGIFSVDATCPIDVETGHGYFHVIGDAEAVDMTLYSIDGRVVYSNPHLVPGEEVRIPAGIYIFSSSFLNSPFKIEIK